MVVVGMLGLSATAPTGADAFLGESSVLNGAKTDLTGPAKTILTKPTFLPANVGEAAVFGGASEASGAAGVFQGAGLLPALGAVVSFGVGTVIGSEICNVIGIEGCWYHHSDGADPSVSGGTWLYNDTTYAEIPFYTWYWDSTDGGTQPDWGQYADPGKCFSDSLPSGYTSLFFKETSSIFCESKTWTDVVSDYALRGSMTNRSIDYHASDDPEISNYSHTAPSNWSEKLAAELKNEGDTEAGRVGEKIASEIEESGVSNPYAVTVAVPSCSGESWLECKADLEELELVPERDTLTWEEAQLDLDPDEVVELQPQPETIVETGTKVVVTTNPAEADMPLVVPEIGAGESYADYIKKLAPAWVPSQHELSPEFTDPHKGPGDVTRTSPVPGTRADPATEPAIDVYNNPTDAPPAAGSWTAPTIPAIDLSPLSGVAIGCNDFPFGIFCWIGDGLTSWGGGGACPNVDVPLGSSAGVESGLPFDFCEFEPAMEIIRPIIALVAAFSLAYLFAAAAMGFGGSTGSED